MFTKHGEIRRQQRGIPPAIISWLQEFRATKYSRDARKRFFDKSSRKRLSHAVGQQIVDRLGDLLNCYVVETLEGEIITVGHRTQRIGNQ